LRPCMAPGALIAARETWAGVGWTAATIVGRGGADPFVRLSATEADESERDEGLRRCQELAGSGSLAYPGVGGQDGRKISESRQGRLQPERGSAKYEQKASAAETYPASTSLDRAQMRSRKQMTKRAKRRACTISDGAEAEKEARTRQRSPGDPAGSRGEADWALAASARRAPGVLRCPRSVHTATRLLIGLTQRGRPWKSD